MKSTQTIAPKATAPANAPASAKPLSPRQTIDALNRLLAIHDHSLAMYLTSFAPWTPAGDGPHQQATATLAVIVADHRALSAKIAEVIDARGGLAEGGSYPMTYTDLHDLSIDFLVQELIRSQRRDLVAIERIAEELGADVQARRLADTAALEARKHLAALEKLQPQRSR